MEQSTPSFNDIIRQNQLIKGRLKLSSRDLDKLYRLIIKQHEQSLRKLKNQQKKVQFHMRRISELKIELKHNSETLQKAFFPINDKISLLYKKIGQQYYIKARIYWQGQQREVQVGSIPIIMDHLKILQNNGELESYRLPISDLLTWDKIKKNDSLMSAIRVVAALKFQEYIIRKLMNGEIQPIEIDEVVRKEAIIIEEVKKEIEKSKDVHKEINDTFEGEQTDWYVQWRENNLK